MYLKRHQNAGRKECAVRSPHTFLSHSSPCKGCRGSQLRKGFDPIRCAVVHCWPWHVDPFECKNTLVRFKDAKYTPCFNMFVSKCKALLYWHELWSVWQEQLSRMQAHQGMLPYRRRLSSLARPEEFCMICWLAMWSRCLQLWKALPLRCITNFRDSPAGGM